jgi:hypothetical protein
VRIKDLKPGSAWNETERRAIPLALVGFFGAGLLTALGYQRWIREPFVAGICGAIGLFLGSIAFLLGVYHRRVALGIVTGLVTLAVPAAATSFSQRLVGDSKASLLPSVLAGIGLYIILHGLHLRLSGLTLEGYVAELAHDEHWNPKPKWKRGVYRVCVALGAAILIALLAGWLR